MPGDGQDGGGAMNGDGSARRNMAYSYGFKAIKVLEERGDDGELTLGGF